MKCSICKHGEPRPGETTVALTREGTTAVMVLLADLPEQLLSLNLQLLRMDLQLI